MARKRTRKKIDKKIFKRTAKRVHKKNLIPKNMRGGMRI